MNEIHSVGSNNAFRLIPLFAEGIKPHVRSSPAYSAPLSDQLELSDRALALAEPPEEQGEDLRTPKLDRLRTLIERGLYDTPERLAVTADRLLDVLNLKSSI